MVLTLSNADKKVLRELEESLWRADSRFDVPYLEQILAEDFFEFGRSGRIYSREETLAAAWHPLEAVIPLPDLEIRLLTPEVAQVTYNSVVTFDGGLEYGRRSSIWSRTAVGWVLRFHQGTPFDSGAKKF